eukprot:COSAG06_NODE_8925_length_2031_cov_1.684265_1_plen_34_part_10
MEKGDGTQGLVPSAYIKEIIQEVRAIATLYTQPM